MAKKTRELEMYVGYLDKTWDTMDVNVPSDTPDDKLEEVGRKCLLRRHFAHDVAFTGLYFAASSDEEE